MPRNRWPDQIGTGGRIKSESLAGSPRNGQRNGAPFKNWILPGALGRVRRRLAGHDDGDRQMVQILTAVVTDGLPAVQAACTEALDADAVSADVVLNALARQQQPEAPGPVMTPERLELASPPLADCARYDVLRISIDNVAQLGVA